MDLEARVMVMIDIRIPYLIQALLESPYEVLTIYIPLEKLYIKCALLNLIEKDKKDIMHNM